MEAPSLHSNVSSPGEEVVGGLFFDFGAVRTESSDRDAPRRAKRIKQERDRHEQYKAQYEAYVEKKIEKAAGPRKKKAGRKKGPGK